MQRQLDVELEKLKVLILEMGGWVKEAIDESVNGLLERDPKRFVHVLELEKSINRRHLDIDDLSIKLLATQSPVAVNLRYAVAIMKINSDLERMADQAVNIALNGRYYLKEPEEEVREEIAKMAAEVKVMVNDSLQSFVENDITLAAGVIIRDETVDAFKDQIFRELIPFMQAESKTVQRSMELILISRNIERIGDHAVNIAEDVIFACTGEDVRHANQLKQSSAKLAEFLADVSSPSA